MSWTAGYDSRNRLTQFDRAGSETRYTYDPNSNRLSALDKTTADTDLNGEFDQADFSLSTGQTLNIAANSNRLLGLTQSFTKVRATKTLSIVNANVTYTLDAAGNLTSDGLRDFEYDEANRLSKVKLFKDGEAAKVRYLTNALGQRVFKGEPETEQTGSRSVCRSIFSPVATLIGFPNSVSHDSDFGVGTAASTQAFRAVLAMEPVSQTQIPF
ncbi:MAG: RHS repeat protein [Hylemonella sp.]|nr:RHS repeat protein [Hylemonella sp.]